MCLWKYDAGDWMARKMPWNYEEGSGWYFLGKPWGLSHGVYFDSCSFGILWFLCTWFAVFLCTVQGLAALLWCHIVIDFHAFLLICLLCLHFKFWVLGIVWERRKLMELERALWYPKSNVRLGWRWCMSKHRGR